MNENCINLKKNAREIRKVTLVGMLVNLFLTGLKFAVGIFGSSQAVIADAVHSLSDMITDLAILFGVKYWSTPADDDHPYGHARIETLITLGIGLILFIVAGNLFYKAIITIPDKDGSPPMLIALLGPFVSIIFKEIIYRWTIKVGKRIKSSSLIANAWHHRSDSLSSIPALAAVAVAAINPKWAFVDHIGAIVVSIFIIRAAFQIIRPALEELTDKGLSEPEQSKIRQIVSGVGGVKAFHGLRTRRTASLYFIDLHILVEDDLSVKEGHDIAENVKNTLKSENKSIYDVLVHIEPYYSHIPEK